MDAVLAILVLGAVIFFGALISIGNERQTKALDGIREQAALWAIQDLHIKREHLAREVRVDDPLGWLNRVAFKVSNRDLGLQIAETFDEPRALVCTAGDGSGRVVFTPVSPDEIRRLKKEKHSRLSQVAAQSPLLLLPRKTTAYEISALNGGMVFDLELPLAWNGLTGQRVDQMERVWMYMIT